MNEADDILNFSYASRSEAESRIALHVVQQFLSAAEGSAEVTCNRSFPLTLQ